jgi:putative tricarboxylic transport membrane protein
MPAHPRHPGELGFTLLLIAGALLVGREAWRIAGSAGPSSPGFGPRAMVAVVLAGLATVLARILLARPAAAEPVVARLRRIYQDVLPLPVTVAFLLLFLYVAALETLGFVPASFAFLTVSMLLLLRGPLLRRALLALPIAAGTVAAIRFLFQEIFRVLLP